MSQDRKRKTLFSYFHTSSATLIAVPSATATPNDTPTFTPNQIGNLQRVGSTMDLVATTKELLQFLRDEGFDILLYYVISVCEKFRINMPDISARYMDGIRSVRQRDDISVEYHYHYDVFNSAIDFQLEELQYRFNDNIVELLRLSSSLKPQTILVCLTRSRCLLLQAPFTLLILVNKRSTTERVFTAMKLFKTVLRNKMDEEYLRDSMVINNEREFTEDIDQDEVIDEFYAQKNRRVQLK